MTEQDVFTIVEMVDAMNRGRYAPAMVVEGQIRNVGVLWAQELEDVDAVLATETIAALFNSTSSFDNPRPITIRDFKEVLGKIEHDRRMAQPALEEPEWVREMPAWVKGWALARSRGETRVWPQQKEGYDHLQGWNMWNRTYIWGEQGEVMPEEARQVYEERAAKLDADAFDLVFAGVTGMSR